MVQVVRLPWIPILLMRAASSPYSYEIIHLPLNCCELRIFVSLVECLFIDHVAKT